MSRGTKRDSSHNVLASVGNKIRERRRERGITLPQLAESAGVSVGLVSQIERGKGNPNLTTLVTIGEALDFSLVRLLAPDTQDSPVLRFSDRGTVESRDSGGALHKAQLLSKRVDTVLETIQIETEPGASTGPEPISHLGEEIGIVLEGRREVHLGDDIYLLQAGDTISYSSTIPHWHRNPGPDVERSIWVVTPPRGDFVRGFSNTP